MNKNNQSTENKWTRLADIKSIEKTAEALTLNGIEVIVLDNGQQANEKVINLIPQGAEVMNMTSVTLDSIGLSQEINQSGKYHSVRNQLMKLDKKTDSLKMQKLRSAPKWAVGSVHAVTEDGKIMIASVTGSQLPAYAYGSAHVVWVVGTQKIVKNIDEGIKRIYEYVLPLESERARKAYGNDGSSVNKILIINKEETPGRIILIFVKEKLGF